MKSLALLFLVSSLLTAQDATEQEAMKKWMEIATPGAEHQLLAEMAGSWKLTAKWRMTPDQPWQTSESLCENKMILGGRFLQTQVSGTMWGMPFEGFGLMGYDNDKKLFTSTWGDSFGTMLVHATGTADMQKKEIDMHSQFEDPMSGQTIKTRSVYTIKSKSECLLSMYSTGPDGQEFLSMEMIYKK